METILPKEGELLSGVIAYGTGADGKPYVLHTDGTWFVIYRANGTELEEVFQTEDQDEDLVFDEYEDAIAGFQYFLENDCIVKNL